MVANDAQRHFLDKRQVDAFRSRKFNQRQHVLIVAALQNHRVKSNAEKTGGDGGVDAGEHIGQLSGAGHGLKAVGVKTI